MIVLKSRLLAALQDEPVEDCVSHPIEEILGETLAKNPSEARSWFHSIFLAHVRNPAAAAALLQCAGRLRRNLLMPEGKQMALAGLNSPSIEVREAAVSAIEQWGGEDLAQALRDHRETVPWLGDYVKNVIRDLSSP